LKPVTRHRSVTFKFSSAILCGFGYLLLFGCSARPLDPLVARMQRLIAPPLDPLVAQMQRLMRERNDAAADCNRQIGELVEFHGKYGDLIDRNSKNQKTCSAAGSAGRNCLPYEQEAVNAMSLMDGLEPPNCAIDADACTITEKRFEENETCFHEKFVQAYSTICSDKRLSRRCIRALDASVKCHPGLPNLSACNQMVQIQIQAREIAHVLQEDPASIKVPMMTQETPVPNYAAPSPSPSPKASSQGHP
jgi:hypothetical protein